MLAFLELDADERARRGSRARERIVTEFGLERMVQCTEELLAALARRRVAV